jgi:hypothetical protein
MKFRLQEAIKASLTGKRAFLTISGGLLAYFLLAFFSVPTYSSQLLSRSWTYLPEVMSTATIGMIETTGMIGLILTLTYSAITGITITNAYLSIRSQSFSRILDVGAFLPGLIVTGCASCGAGLLAVLGFTGALATLPFEGNLIKLGGILVMAGLLNHSGNPEICANPNA